MPTGGVREAFSRVEIEEYFYYFTHDTNLFIKVNTITSFNVWLSNFFSGQANSQMDREIILCLETVSVLVADLE